MRKVQLLIKVFLLVTVVLLGFQKGAYAEQLNKSVKDCIETPDKCSDNSDNKNGTSKEGTKAEVKEQQSVGLTFWDFFKMIFATIFVVALLYFMLKFINKKSKVFKSTQIIENIGGATLGANRSVQMIKVGNRLLVVGVGENIQLLKEIDEEEEYRQIIEDYNNKMEQLVQPSDIVTKVLQRTKSFKMTETEGKPFQSILKKQLEEISQGRKKLFDEMEKKGPDER